MLRKGLIGLLILAVLALDWAALHDIIKGEPDAWMEWTFVLGSLLLGGLYIYRFLRRSKET